MQEPEATEEEQELVMKGRLEEEEASRYPGYESRDEPTDTPPAEAPTDEA